MRSSRDIKSSTAGAGDRHRRALDAARSGIEQPRSERYREIIKPVAERMLDASNYRVNPTGASYGGRRANAGSGEDHRRTYGGGPERRGALGKDRRKSTDRRVRGRYVAKNVVAAGLASKARSSSSSDRRREADSTWDGVRHGQSRREDRGVIARIRPRRRHPCRCSSPAPIYEKTAGTPFGRKRDLLGEKRTRRGDRPSGHPEHWACRKSEGRGGTARMTAGGRLTCLRCAAGVMIVGEAVGCPRAVPGSIDIPCALAERNAVRAASEMDRTNSRTWSCLLPRPRRSVRSQECLRPPFDVSWVTSSRRTNP